MAIEKIRVGIIGASMRNGWGRDAHIPALRALPEFEITAVSTSRQEPADETAKHFRIPHAKKVGHVLLLLIHFGKESMPQSVVRKISQETWPR
jgi:hypothetical protein